MKISINKKLKRALSLALAVVMLCGTFFTANVGINIKADAQASDVVQKTVVYWDGTSSVAPTKQDAQGNYIIETPAQLHYIATQIGPSDSTGKSYKVADNMIFVLQPESVITDLDAFKAYSSAQVQSFFESSTTKVNWVQAKIPKIFNGNFDGNGVEIYGLYSDGCAVSNLNVGSEYSALFPYVDGGEGGTGITIKNFSVYGAYVRGIRRAGIITGMSAAATGGAKVTGFVNLNSIVVGNCYILCVGTKYVAGDNTEVTQTNRDGTETGILAGNSSGDPTCASNILVYGTVSEYKTNYDDSTSSKSLCLIARNSTNGSIQNSVIIDAKMCTSCAKMANCSAVYTNLTSPNANYITKIASADAAKGTVGRVNMSGLTWSDKAENVDDGNAYWYARKNDYPTPIRPADDYWRTAEVPSVWSGSAAADFAGGTGTETDPYIIKTADQLYRALSLITDTTNNVAGGIQSGTINEEGTTNQVPVYTPYYYKVADGVKKLYLNNIVGSESLDGIKDFVAANSSLKNWQPGKSFVGHLDGNGVTIYGMYCNATYNGLIYKFDGTATVKNINFDSCYAKSTNNRSALLTTQLGSWRNDSTIHTVSNISVRNCHIETTKDITVDSSNKTHLSAAAGIISTTAFSEKLVISNCLFDGKSCERVIGAGSEPTANMFGGIISGGTNLNSVLLLGCVSLGAPVVDEVYVAGKEVNYTRYATSNTTVLFYDCYSSVESQVVANYPGTYDKLKNIVRTTDKYVYEMCDMPTLTWGNNWQLVTFGERTIPMPKANAADGVNISYGHVIGDNYSSIAGPYAAGTYGYWHELEGMGTEDNPYIIKTDVQLARAIATGGKNLDQKLYYKLGCDIDVSSARWIDQTAISIGTTKYTYKQFEGVLDGDGHVVTGLSAGDTTKSIGLIPVLASGGTVKNLHVRNSTVAFSHEGDKVYAGVLVGDARSGSTIEGCSVEKSTVSSKNDTAFIVGNASPMKNCYYINEADNEIGYYDANNHSHNNENISIWTPDPDVWYVGGAEGSLPRLINCAQAMENADITGDGAADDYAAADLVALRNKLLKKADYTNIYGDVNHDGATNISDLAILRRAMVGTYNGIKDSFWRNMALGKIHIYYGENDNYDAARKLELYFEAAIPGLDVKKHVSAKAGTISGTQSNSSKVYLHANDTEKSPTGELEVIVGNIDNYNAYDKTKSSATVANTYAVSYDKATQVVWLQGENFTAVEQAVLDFIAGSNRNGDKVFTCDAKTLSAEKQPVQVKLDRYLVNDYFNPEVTPTTLYYAWGEEFDGNDLNYEIWNSNSQQSESSNGETSEYMNQEVVPVKYLDELLVVENGKLSMKRGHAATLGATNEKSVALDVKAGDYNYYGTIENGDQYFSSGKLTTESGMLYKQGYIEFAGRLPADGHAFPAWWLMGRPTQSATNTNYDRSLFGKVYKLNDQWDSSKDSIVANDISSYKYQIPTANYEIDMIEVMQNATRYGRVLDKKGTVTLPITDTMKNERATAIGWYQIESSVHKWYNNGVVGDNLYIIDWATGSVFDTISSSAFASTATDSWTHTIRGAYHDFGSLISTHKESADNYATYYTGEVSADARDNLEKQRRYGFSWYTNGVDQFEISLYIYDDSYDIGFVRVPIAVSDKEDYNQFKDMNKNNEAEALTNVYSDAKVFNQYMYILFNNNFYSANATSGNNPVQFTDLLTAAGLGSLELDYVRVYQEKGKRDIVTKETESFNNNNHFGY